MGVSDEGFKKKKETILNKQTNKKTALTLSQVVPVNAGEERVAAESLETQSFLSGTQQPLQQVEELFSDTGFLWKLEKTLRALI